jgi:predicted dehydrogenase
MPLLHNRKLRGAIIGYGFVSASGHLPAYLKRSQELGDIEIVAVADICQARRNLAREALPHVRVYSDYRSLFDVEASNLEFVDIATPPCNHAEIAHAAFAAGFHVLCEKPLTCTLEEARSLLNHASAVQRVLFPCHNYKHAPVVKAIREIIQSGRIGKVHSATLNIYRNTHAKGVTEWNSHWRRESRYSGGGIAMDHGYHSFYLTFDWLGSYPTSIAANMSNLESGKYDTEDDFSAVLTFPTGMAHVYLTWTAGVRKVVYTIEGKKGVITVEDDDLQIKAVRRTARVGIKPAPVRNVERRSISSHWADSSHADWFSSVLDEFREAIERGDVTGKDVHEALLCVQLINTAYRSARENSRELPLGSWD